MSRRHRPRRLRRRPDYGPDTVHLVQWGATSADDPDEIDEVQATIHGDIVEALGDRRIGPVVWWRVRATDAARRLRSGELPPVDGDRGLRQMLRWLDGHPDGWLVYADAPSDLTDEELDGEEILE